MSVGEAILGALLAALFTVLTSRDFLNFARREGISKKLDMWRKTLSMIEEVLVDAEEKQLTERAVKVWLDDLRDLAYDLEDLLDEFATESLRRTLMEGDQNQGSSSTSLVSTRFSFARFKGSTGKFNRKMRSNINKVGKRLEVICKRRVELGLQKGKGSSSSKVWQKPPSASVPNESAIYGRDEDKKKIIDLLLREESSDQDANFRVIPIVGMGGIGKTTLAQHVYHDEAVLEYFHPKAWVCVSDDFDVMRIAKAILESITCHPCDLKEYNEVQVKLREALAGKKFLLVLDDVWNKNYGLWEALKPPFLAGASGSRIILTTREINVARMIGPSKHYNLEPLSDDECWSVFAKHAFESRNIRPHANLESIREKIVKKCGGLPLAARTLGGLLRNKQRDTEWEDILDSKIWDLPDSESDILPVLRLSYYHLPSHLKRCFTYCAIIPKDFEFKEKDLVLLWMAEGLLQHTQGNKQMEDLGGEYFQDLVSRSIFQISSSDKSFVMHDLVNDLAQWAAGETCFVLDGEMEDKKQSKVSRRARHSSYVREYCDGIKKFEVFHMTDCLRTFLPLPLTGDQGCWLTNHVLYDLLPKLRYLRVLSLCSYNISKLPDSIGELKHLRFLNLSHTRITCLPESTCSLYNLQTLLLKECSFLKYLPSKIENLINLRHLDITNASSIKEMPLGIGELKNLQTLSNFVVGENVGSRITALMNLKSLRGKLCIASLENVVDAHDAREANINDKQDVDALLLQWRFNLDSFPNGRVEKDILDNLRPQSKLKELTIQCYAGLSFPTWVGNPSFSAMVQLRLENCLRCTLLPSLGQLPSLKILTIVNLMAVKKVGLEFYGDGCSKPFPLLEILQFEGMREWEEWISCGVGYEEFPLLRKLSIARCPKLLKKLPNSLPSLEKLVIENCKKLVVSIHRLPSLCKLEIKGCKEMVCEGAVDLNLLNSLIISDISKLTFLTERFIQPFLKELEVSNCMGLVSLYQNGETFIKQLISLQNLVIHGCPQVASLLAEDKEEEEEEEEQLQQRLANCEIGSLTISLCETLEKLPQWFHSLVSLKELKIQDCPRLLSFPVAGLPCMLRVIRILNCNSLTSLPAAVTGNSMCLEHLCIQGCDSLTSFGRYQLPPTLKKLEIKICKNLVCLLDDGEESSLMTSQVNISSSSNNASLLEYLIVERCDSLISIAPKGNLPAALKHLQIHSCPKLVSLPSGDWLSTGLKHLSIHSCQNLKSMVASFYNNLSLKDISIWFCNNLKSLPEGGLPASLRRLIIIECEKLEAIPDRMYNLTSLQELRITYCPHIVSFPEEGLPTSLTSLWIIDLKIYEIGMMLPPTLTRLRIRDFPNLEYLSCRGFQNLTSLQELWISDCPKLISFPKKGLPPSVLELRIERCPFYYSSS
ncbi:hypothetical protein GH714_007825 [Hevea brasiliensis]|uniref:Disease resistance RPP13-like protein 1 n=1 Tax=Hevea brasiliensis TaxID=3981 RepID=A0A6A6LF61_HEVBR|nr:hypothetical protein GH714_007825 [Hevea brasiliensis]